MTVKNLVKELLNYDLNSQVKFLCEVGNEQLKELDLESGEEISTYADIKEIYESSDVPFSEIEEPIIELRIEL